MSSNSQTSHQGLRVQGESAVQTLRSRFSGQRQAQADRLLDLLSSADAQIHDLQQQVGACVAKCDTLQIQFAASQAAAQELNQQHASLEKQWHFLSTEYDKLTTARNELQSHLEQVLIEKTEAAAQLESLIKRHAKLQAEKRAVDEDYTQLAAGHASLQDQLLGLQSQYENLLLERNGLQERLASSLSEKVKIADKFADLQEQDQFLTSVLAAKPDKDPRLQQLYAWLQEDYSGWLHALPLGEGGTAALLWAHSLVDRVVLRKRVPAFRGKTIVAVAGGFSSGKSSFITSLMKTQDGRRLPVGIKPVTAVPTYVVSGTGEVILGHTASGGIVPISADWFQRFSHQELKNWGFKLQSVLPFITLESQLQTPAGKWLEHIAFIDLPGFSAARSEGGHEEEDAQTAMEFLFHADAVIWAIGLDANGTIPQTDLNKLFELQSIGLHCYVLLTKGDLKSTSALTQVLDHVRSVLEQEGIEVIGIGIHSTKNSALIHNYHNKSIDDFLHEIDKPHNWETAIQQEIEEEFQKIQIAASGLRDREALLLKEIKGLELDLLERATIAKTAAAPQKGRDKEETSTPMFRLLAILHGLKRDDTSVEESAQQIEPDEILTIRIKTLRNLLGNESRMKAILESDHALHRLKEDLYDHLKELNVTPLSV
jgi:GTP-binding protein EngB required for normal cell division